MVDHIKYIMKAQINEPPYQKVTWAVWDSPDNTGAYSGYDNLVNIEVDYTILNEVPSGGNTGVSPTPVIPAPPIPLVAKIAYVMKAEKSTAPYELITWKVYDTPDNTGALSGYDPSELINIAVDYSVFDDVNRGPQAVPTVNYLIGPASGDLDGSYPDPTVVGFYGNPLDSSLASPNLNQAIIWNGTNWIGGAINLAGGSSYVTGLLPDANQAAQTMLGDVTGTTAAAVVAKLRGKLLDTALASLGAAQDGYLLTWNNSNGQWEASTNVGGVLAGDVTGPAGANTVVKIQNEDVASTTPQDGYVFVYRTATSKWEVEGAAPPFGAAGGDLGGTYPNPDVVKIRGKTLASALASIGATQDGYVLTWDNGSTSWTAQQISTLRGKILNTSLANIGAAQDGYLLTWDNGTSSWKASPNVGAILAGDVTGDPAANTVERIQNVDVTTDAPTDGYVFVYRTGTSKWEIESGAPPFGAAGGDLSGNYPNPYIKSISGNGGAGGTVDVTADKFLFGSSVLNPQIIQDDTASGVGQPLYIVAQTTTDAAKGGDVFIQAGSGGTTQGDIELSANSIKVTSTTVKFNGLANSAIDMAPTSLGIGKSLSLIGQESTGYAGGDLILSSGSSSLGAASYGNLYLQTGGTTRFTIAPNGAITTTSSVTVGTSLNANSVTTTSLTVSGLSTGVVHSNGSGVFSSSLIVNADVDAAAAIAYSKLNLSNSIVNADVNSSAAIAYSKLNLSNSIVNADVNTSAAIAVSKLAAGTANYVLTTNGSTNAFSLLVNANIDASAAIAYSKLNLSGSIVNADVNASAAIAYSKLNLSNSIVNADVNSSAAIAYSKLNLSGSIVNADVSTSAAIAVSKLAAGTAGQLLLNNSTPTPTWTTVSGDATISNTGVVSVNALQSATTSVNVSSATAPSSGQVLTATSSTTATWQDPGGGGFTPPITLTYVAKTANYTITTSDYVILCDSTGGAFNITLPTVTSGQSFIIKDKGGAFNTNNVTLVRAGSEKIENVAANRALTAPYGVYHVFNDGTNWWII